MATPDTLSSRITAATAELLAAFVRPNGDGPPVDELRRLHETLAPLDDLVAAEPGTLEHFKRSFTDALGIRPEQDPIKHAQKLRDAMDGIQRVLGCTTDYLTEVQAVELLEHKNGTACTVYEMLGVHTLGLYSRNDVDERLLVLTARIERLKHCEEIVKKLGAKSGVTVEQIIEAAVQSEQGLARVLASAVPPTDG